MSPIKHYQRLMGTNSEELPPSLRRVLSEILKRGSLESLASKKGAFEKSEDYNAQGAFEVRESGTLYILNSKIQRIKGYKKDEITDQDATKQKLEQAGAKNVSVYCVTEYIEDGKIDYTLDIELPFDLNEDDVRMFVAHAEYFHEHHEEKVRVSGIHRENGTFKVMEEYFNGEEYKEVEALGLKKDDLLNVISTAPSEDKDQSEDSLEFLETMIHTFISKLESVN